MNYDVKASVINLRESKKAFKSGYKPTFEIHSNYATSGEIYFVNREWLNYNELTQAYIRFLTPEIYPKSLWVGKKILFREGQLISGEAVILEVLNKELLSDDNKEKPINFKIKK